MNQPIYSISFMKVLETGHSAFRNVGVDIYTGKTLFNSIILWYVVIHILGMMCTMILFIRESLITGEHILKAISSFLLMLTQLAALIKVNIVYYHRYKIKTIFERLETRYPVAIGDQLNCNLHQYENDLKVLKYLKRFSLSCILALVLVPLTLVPYIYYKNRIFVPLLPIDGKFPFPVESIQVYAFCCLLQIYGGVIITYVFICFEIIIETMVILICINLDLLAMDIRKLFPYNQEFRVVGGQEVIEVMVASKFDETKNQIAGIVERHHEIIEVVNDMNEVFGLGILYAFVTDTAIICLNFFTSLVGIIKPFRGLP